LLSMPLLASAAGFIEMKPSKYPPRIHADAQRTLSKYGPFVLRGASGSRGGSAMGGMSMGDNTLSGQNFFQTIKRGICGQTTNGGCTVWGGNISIEYANGGKASPATGVYNHHLLTVDTSKKTTNFLSACDNPGRTGTSVSGLGGTGFVGLGEDSGNGPVLYTARDGSSKAGYWVSPGSSFTANIDLVNYSKESQTVYITYDLEWTMGKPSVNTKGMLVSVTQCMGKQIKLSQSGPTNTTSGKFTFLEDGTILTARGHLHDGGHQMDMFINNKYVCSSKATYGGDAATAEVGGKEWKTISAMSYCDGPIHVKKGDTFSMVVEYDLKRYPLRKSASGHEAGVMGMWSVTFAPSV